MELESMVTGVDSPTTTSVALVPDRLSPSITVAGGPGLYVRDAPAKTKSVPLYSTGLLLSRSRGSNDSSMRAKHARRFVSFDFFPARRSARARDRVPCIEPLPSRTFSREHPLKCEQLVYHSALSDARKKSAFSEILVIHMFRYVHVPTQCEIGMKIGSTFSSAFRRSCPAAR